MVQSPLRSISLADFLNLPETKPANEFVDGQIIPKPMPQGQHSTIQGELVSTINALFKPSRIARAYPELRCSFDGNSIIPDVAVFTWQNIPRNPDGKVANVFTIAPDWTIEILSPGQNQSKVVRNILRCLDAGSLMGWLIDPAEELVFIYFADRKISVFADRDNLLPTPEFASSFQLTIGQLFDWLED
jgi:Uma2 family endonuclease